MSLGLDERDEVEDRIAPITDHAHHVDGRWGISQPKGLSQAGATHGVKICAWPLWFTVPFIEVCRIGHGVEMRNKLRVVANVGLATVEKGHGIGETINIGADAWRAIAVSVQMGFAKRLGNLQDRLNIAGFTCLSLGQKQEHRKRHS